MWFLHYEKLTKIIKTEISLGRGKSNGIVIDKKTVSKTHLKLIPTDKGMIVKDLGSTMGTKIDEEAIDTVTIAPIPKTTINIGGIDVYLYYMDLVVCTTGLSNYKNDMVTVVDQITSNVNFLLASGIAITAKVVLSLCYGIPIVTAEFVDDLEKLLPDYGRHLEDYKPNLLKASKQFGNVNFSPILGRRTLFEGVTVVTVGKTEVDTVKLVVEAASGVYLNYDGKFDGFEEFLDSITSDKIAFVKHAKLAAGITKVLDNRELKHVSSAAIHSAILYNTLDDLNVYSGVYFLIIGTGKRKAVDTANPPAKRQTIDHDASDEIIPPTPVRKYPEPPRQSSKIPVELKASSPSPTRKSPEPRSSRHKLPIASKPRQAALPTPKPLPSHIKFNSTQLSQPQIKISTESPFSHNSLRKQPIQVEESAELPLESAYQTQTGGSLFDNFMDDVLGFEPMDVGHSIGNSVESLNPLETVQSEVEPANLEDHSIDKQDEPGVTNVALDTTTVPVPEIAQEIPTIPQPIPQHSNGETLKSIEIKVEIVSMCAPSRPMANYKQFRNKNFARPRVLGVVPSGDILSGRSNHNL